MWSASINGKERKIIGDNKLLNCLTTTSKLKNSKKNLGNVGGIGHNGDSGGVAVDVKA